MIELDIASAQAMRQLGVRLAGVLRAGDLVVLVGSLGAGKTTLTQGIGAGLGVRGDVTSPTFVIARVHPARTDGPALVHVDAYRIAGALEIDRLDIEITWAADVDTDTRRVQITSHGSRWDGVELSQLLAIP